jgi:hypothetical protein
MGESLAQAVPPFSLFLRKLRQINLSQMFISEVTNGNGAPRGQKSGA